MSEHVTHDNVDVVIETGELSVEVSEVLRTTTEDGRLVITVTLVEIP